jgi:hypothetical protein
MSDQKPGMFVPALIGGAFAGVLSGIPLLNCLCCLWIIGGGMIAAHFLTKDSPLLLTAGDGAIVGVFAGIIGAVIEFIISIPLTPLTNAYFRGLMEKFAEFAEDMPSGWESFLERGAFETSAPWAILGLVINVVIFSIFGALGGVIGISLFKKKGLSARQGVIDVPKDQVKTETPDNHQS